jgi:hypothetical protein
MRCYVVIIYRTKSSTFPILNLVRLHKADARLVGSSSLGKIVWYVVLLLESQLPCDLCGSVRRCCPDERRTRCRDCGKPNSDDRELTDALAPLRRRANWGSCAGRMRACARAFTLG